MKAGVRFAKQMDMEIVRVWHSSLEHLNTFPSILLRDKQFEQSTYGELDIMARRQDHIDVTSLCVWSTEKRNGGERVRVARLPLIR